MNKRKYSKCKTYLLPLIAEVLDLDIKFMPYLINTFMFDSENQYVDCFYILHEFNFKNPEFTHYEHKLTNNKLFVKNIDLDNKVVYVFKFPEEYLPEYYFLMNSEYSKFGDDAKKLILRFWGQVYSGNPLGVNFLIKVKNILYKEEKLRKKLELDLGVKLDEDQELGDFVNLENETFKIEDFKQSKIIK